MPRMRLGLLLGLGVFLSLPATPARAQIPLFYGGEVLTPLGNRRSDGGYIYPHQDPRNRARVVAPATRTYRQPRTTYYAPQRVAQPYYEMNRRGRYVMRYR